MTSQDRRGSFYAILSGFLYGFIGFFGMSAINAQLSVSTMLFWRFLISSLVMMALVALQIRTMKDSFKALFMAYLNGVFFYGCSTYLYFCASMYIGSGFAMVLFFTYPVFIMILNYLLYGENMTKIYYIAILVILLGMILLIDFNQISFDLTGLVLTLISSLFYAGYVMASKKSDISPQGSTLMVCLGCMTTSFVVAMVTQSLEMPSTLSVWANLFGIGVIATVIPILLLLISLKYISSEKASILSVLEPVFVVIFGVLLLDESMQAKNAVGIVLILSGALMTLFSHRINLAQMKLIHKLRRAYGE